MTSPPHRRAWFAVLASTLLAVAGAGSGQAASSTTVVSMQVPSATTLDVVPCTGVAAATSFGTVLPGTSAVTTADCDIRFGSSNDTSALRISQVDGRGPAMFRPIDGPVDTSFATGGTLSLDPSPNNDVFWEAVEMPDGDIQLSGHYEPAAGDGGLLLARLTSSGAPRATFGVNGVVTLNDVPGSQMGWVVNGRSDGSIIVGAERSGGTALARFLANGTQDMAWGGDGWRELPDAQTPRVMRTDQTGRIYVAGTRYWPIVNCAVTRMLADGTIDTAYGTNGTAYVGVDQTQCDGMDVDRSGRVVIAAQNSSDLVLARLTTTGATDLTYGGGERRYDPPDGALSYYFDVVVLPDGGAIYAGSVNNAVFLSRYDASGALVNSFGGDGHVRLAAHPWSVRDLAWVDGRIVVVGDYGSSNVLRLLADGSLDPSYSQDGVDDPAVPAQTDDNGLLLMGDGRALLFGRNGSAAQASMLRSASVTDYVGGATDWDQGSGFFGACLRNVTATGDPLWTANASCTSSDGTWWNDVPTVAESIATSDAGQDATIASLRFAMRVPTSQPPGAYVAPLRLEVVAPAA